MFFKKDKEISIRDYVARDTFLTERVSEYSEWYDQNGLILPPDYATDPTGWTEDLHKIVQAFELLDKEILDETELSEEEKKKIIEGFTIFGKQLYYLSDTVKLLIKAH